LNHEIKLEGVGEVGVHFQHLVGDIDHLGQRPRLFVASRREEKYSTILMGF